MTLSDLLASDLTLLRDNWERHLRNRGYARTTITNYVASVRLLDEYLQRQGMPQSVGAINRDHIESFVGAVLQERSAATALARYRALKLFWMWLIEIGETKDTLFKNMTPPRVSVPQTPVLKLDEIRDLLRVCDKDKSFIGKRDHALLRVIATTGARRSEICDLALDAEHYDMRAGVLRRRNVAPELSADMPNGFIDYEKRQINLVRTKGRRGRVLNVDDKAMLVLVRYVRARALHSKASLPWLWLSNSGRKKYTDSGRLTPGGVNQILDRRCDQAGIKRVGVHVLRHSWVHHSLSKGLGEGNVAELAGWSPSSAAVMLGRYGAVLRRERALEADRELGIGGDL